MIMEETYAVADIDPEFGSLLGALLADVFHLVMQAPEGATVAQLQEQIARASDAVDHLQHAAATYLAVTKPGDPNDTGIDTLGLARRILDEIWPGARSLAYSNLADYLEDGELMVEIYSDQPPVRIMGANALVAGEGSL